MVDSESETNNGSTSSVVCGHKNSTIAGTSKSKQRGRKPKTGKDNPSDQPPIKRGRKKKIQESSNPIGASMEDVSDQARPPSIIVNLAGSTVVTRSVHLQALSEAPPPDSSDPTPEAGALAPEAPAKTPDMRVPTPEAQARTPERGVLTPEAQLQTPDAGRKSGTSGTRTPITLSPEVSEPPITPGKNLSKTKQNVPSKKPLKTAEGSHLKTGANSKNQLIATKEPRKKPPDPTLDSTPTSSGSKTKEKNPAKRATCSYKNGYDKAPKTIIKKVDSNSSDIRWEISKNDAKSAIYNSNFLSSTVIPEKYYKFPHPPYETMELTMETEYAYCPSQKVRNLEIPNTHRSIMTPHQKIRKLPRWSFDREIDWKQHVVKSSGLNDKQMNAYMHKTGYRYIINRVALKKGRQVVVRFGAIRYWITRGSIKTYTEVEPQPDIPSHVKDDKVMVPPFLKPKQKLKLKGLYEKGRQMVFPITREFVKSNWASKFKKRARYKVPKDRQYIPVEGHCGILVCEGDVWRYFDCNNFPGNSDRWIIKYFYKLKVKIFDKISKILKRPIKTLKKLEYVPTWANLGVDNDCALFCLFTIEQLQRGHKNDVLNNTYAQSILFHEKVCQVVGGDIPYKDYRKLNPSWKTDAVRPYRYQKLLNYVLDGYGARDYTRLELEEIKQNMLASGDGLSDDEYMHMENDSDDEDTGSKDEDSDGITDLSDNEFDDEFIQYDITLNEGSDYEENLNVEEKFENYNCPEYTEN